MEHSAHFIKNALLIIWRAMQMCDASNHFCSNAKLLRVKNGHIAKVYHVGS